MRPILRDCQYEFVQKVVLRIGFSVATLIIATDGVAAQPTASDFLPGDNRWNLTRQTYRLKDGLLSSLIYPPRENNKRVTAPSDPIDEEASEIRLVSYQQSNDESHPSGEATIPNPDSATSVDDGTVPTSPEKKRLDNPADVSLAKIQEKVEQQREQISNDSQLSESERTSRLQMLSSTMEWLRNARDYQSKTLGFKNQIQRFSEDQESLNRRLDEVTKPAEPEIQSETTSNSLQRDLLEKKKQLESAKSELERLEQFIKTFAERITLIPNLRAAANERKQQINDTIAGQSSLTDKIDEQRGWLLQQARRLATDAELSMLDVEVEYLELANQITPKRRDLVSRNITRLDRELKSWESAVLRLRKQEYSAEARAAREAAMNAVPALRELAKHNEAIIVQRKTLNAKIQKLNAELETIDGDAENISDRITGLKNKIEAAGLTSSNGMLLVELRRNLLSPGESYVRIRQLKEEMRGVNLNVVGLNEERDALAEPLKFVETQIGRNDESDPLVEMALKFVTSKRDYLDQLLTDTHEYRRVLSDVAVKRQELIDQINETKKFIDENALWVRSAEPIDLGNLREAYTGVAAVGEPTQWRQLRDRLSARISHRPYESALAALGLFALFAFNRRFKDSLADQQESENV